MTLMRVESRDFVQFMIPYLNAGRKCQDGVDKKRRVICGEAGADPDCQCAFFFFLPTCWWWYDVSLGNRAEGLSFVVALEYGGEGGRMRGCLLLWPLY